MRRGRIAFVETCYAAKGTVVLRSGWWTKKGFHAAFPFLIETTLTIPLCFTSSVASARYTNALPVGHLLSVVCSAEWAELNASADARWPYDLRERPIRYWSWWTGTDR